MSQVEGSWELVQAPEAATAAAAAECKALFGGFLCCSPDHDVDLPRVPQDPPPLATPLLFWTPTLPAISPGGGPRSLFPGAPHSSEAKLLPPSWPVSLHDDPLLPLVPLLSLLSLPLVFFFFSFYALLTDINLLYKITCNWYYGAHKENKIILKGANKQLLCGDNSVLQILYMYSEAKH